MQELLAILELLPYLGLVHDWAGVAQACDALRPISDGTGGGEAAQVITLLWAQCAAVVFAWGARCHAVRCLYRQPPAFTCTSPLLHGLCTVLSPMITHGSVAINKKIKSCPGRGMHIRQRGTAT